MEPVGLVNINKAVYLGFDWRIKTGNVIVIFYYIFNVTVSIKNQLKMTLPTSMLGDTPIARKTRSNQSPMDGMETESPDSSTSSLTTLSPQLQELLEKVANAGLNQPERLQQFADNFLKQGTNPVFGRERPIHTVALVPLVATRSKNDLTSPSDVW